MSGHRGMAGRFVPAVVVVGPRCEHAPASPGDQSTSYKLDIYIICTVQYFFKLICPFIVFTEKRTYRRM